MNGGKSLECIAALRGLGKNSISKKKFLKIIFLKLFFEVSSVSYFSNEIACYFC